MKVIPQPAKFELADGRFCLNADTRILVASGTTKGRRIASQLTEIIQPATGFDLQIQTADSRRQADNSILLTTDKAPARLGKEGYQLVVKADSILIRACKPAGLFYGVQTLRQLLPEKIECNEQAGGTWNVPCCSIEDVPRFGWRGMHFDVCRHFFGIEHVKKYIDFLAMHKMNVLHWHLTEDQGWRIEIKKYPKLNDISAWRQGTDMHYWQRKGDRKKHGGIFTHEDVREVVAYAAERFITVVPEIEMPGHAQAAVAAYPELSCTGGPHKVWTGWGVSKNVFCAGNEKVFRFLCDVIDEVVELFPGKYIHIGGDECPKDRWKECPKCQKRIADEGLADEHELQSYFISRMAEYIASHNRKVIGWDEILEGGLAKGAAVMSWRGTAGGIKAAKMKHDVVMTPNPITYFDMKPEPFEDPGDLPGREGFTSLKTVYDLELTTGVPREFRKYVMGGQGCLWTEYVNNQAEVEYMLLPRLSALSEVVWSPQRKRDWKDFQKRLRSFKKRLDVMGVNYCKK